MAKPPSDIPNYTSSNLSDFGPCTGQRSSGVRKRTRRESDLIDDTIEYDGKHTKYSCTEDGYKTRRVNPERLALRLDPGLVAEMDVLIIPGAKMPTFAVRKDFQQRYNVDRRHIYDYFHSRGLRVAKEDKHNNLTSALSLKARKLSIEPKAELLTKREQPREHKEQEVSNSDSEKCNRNASVQLPQERHIRSAKRLATAKISAGLVRRRMSSPSHPKEPQITGFSEMHSPPRAEDHDSQCQSPPSPASPVPDFTLPEEFPDTPLLDEDTCDLMSDSPSELLPDFSDHDLWYNYDIDIPLEKCELDPVMSVDEHRLLTEEERIEFYNLIDKNISPPNGVEECSGTYSAYMKERSRFYFDRLFSKDSRSQTKLYHPNQANKLPDAPVEDADDFRKWLSNSGSQNHVRPAGRFEPEDTKKPEVPNHRSSGGLQYPNFRPYTLNIPSPALEHRTNENTCDRGNPSSPSHCLEALLGYDSIIRHSEVQFKPVPSAACHSFTKLMDGNGSKRTDASRCKLFPLSHGSPEFVRQHVRPTRLRTASAGNEI